MSYPVYEPSPLFFQRATLSAHTKSLGWVDRRRSAKEAATRASHVSAPAATITIEATPPTALLPTFARATGATGIAHVLWEARSMWLLRAACQLARAMPAD